MAYDFDLFAIGAGSGGIATARRAAQYGAKVAVAEFDRLGGTCVNRGCVPKKLMVYASHFASHVKEAAGYGWSFDPGKFDWPTMIKAVNDEVTRLNAIYQRMIDNAEVTLYKGHARIVDHHTIAVAGETVTAEKILIAVGGKPSRPDIPGIELAITSDEIFHLAQQPKRMVIFGGGYIGCEFACVLNALGTEVTQIIRRDKILRGFDEDIRTEVQDAMLRHGIHIINDNLISLEKTDEGLQVNLENNNLILTDVVGLSALGRIPRLENLGLENTRVEVKNGAIVVDAHSQTAESNIYAVGDCTDRINLTPVAINEGRVFADTHYGGKRRVMSHENVPSAVFTTPEVATVGMTETEAIEKYGEAGIRVYRSRFRPMYYTLPKLEEKTLMKLVVHVQTDKVLGAHMVGDAAAEIIQGVAIAVKMGATKADFDATVGIHPSSAEEFVTMR
ncbi:glutathione reductase [Leptolyngbya sp. Heron Island J]|uniref:glutathione-disulfide reductase n=1 Tax=Leptolyngbya sp. Heron Island J TaxID=1385935 RepID=UPI0003B985BA|nr:glutathione-disulfide reductase [Leptolyngbya sp. Heron Island J]ESA36939.1 glutathione reductase [Leptolyngbya sp. Heron Island J]